MDTVLAWWRRYLHAAIPDERLAEMNAVRDRQTEVSNRLRSLSLELDVLRRKAASDSGQHRPRIP